MLNSRLPAYLLLGLEPELDCANGAAASAALRDAACVVSLSAYASQAIREVADVLLPIAAFAETPATFVNAEGRWQSQAAAVTAPGDARPAWKVLRVLGNLFELDGFDYVLPADVIEELRPQCAPTLNAYAAAAEFESGSRSAATALPDGALARVGTLATHALDALVRRADSLQRTRDASFQGVLLHPDEAARLGLNGSGRVRVRQDGESRELPFTVSTAVSPGCAQLVSGVSETAGLGPAHGAIFVEAVSA